MEDIENPDKAVQLPSMNKAALSILIFLGAIFGATLLFAQDSQNPPAENLTPDELEIIRNSKATDEAISKSLESQDEFLPAPDSDIIVPDESTQILPQQDAILEDAGHNQDIAPSVFGNSDDRRIINSTLHRKREMDPAKQAELTELSRILGGLHALRSACNGPADQTYRSKMTSMLDLEAPDSSQFREPLIVAFNFGFRENGGADGQCAEDKNAAKEAALAKIGRKFALKMAARYALNPQKK